MSRHTLILPIYSYLSLFLFILYVMIIAEPVSADDHDVVFGAAVSEHAFNGNWSTHMTEYRSEIKRLFDWVVTTNTGKMWMMHDTSRNEYYWDDLDDMLTWCENNDILMKYHTIIWDHPRIPDWYVDLNEIDSRTALEEHVRAIMARYKGRITMYDVVNEPVNRHELADAGTGYMGTGWDRVEAITNIFNWAHDEDPDATLLINEYYILNGVSEDAYIALIDSLLDAGAPIDGIGIQSHMGINTGLALSDDRINAALDNVYNATGLPIYISEFDIAAPGTTYGPDGNPDDPFNGYDSWWEYQAYAEPHVYALFTSHPAVKSVIRWQYYDVFDNGEATLYDGDFMPRPVFNELENVFVSVSIPSITSVAITPNNGVITVGDSVRIVVTADNNEAGLIASDAQFNGISIPLNDNGDGTYSGIYVVAEIHQSAQNIEATGITLTNSAGTSDAASSHGSTLIIKIPPSIMSVTITPNAGTISVGDTVRIVVTAMKYETGLEASDALINGISIPLTDNNDGTYSGTYVVEQDHQSQDNVEATNITVTSPNGTSPPAASSGSTLRIIIQDTFIAQNKVPEEFILYQNSPNPFNPETTISYRVPPALSERITISIFDIGGALVRLFTNVPFHQNKINSIVWDGKNSIGSSVASGLYICRVTAGNHSRTNKMMLIR